MKFSVIIPVYKAEDTLKRCVDSLINQNRTDAEIILINDGSPDSSGEICKEYAELYKSVKYIKKENGGVSTARNAGLSVATGEYIIFVDSDDWVDETAYMKILDTLHELVDKKQMVDMLVSNYVYEKVGAKHKKVIHYQNVMPEGRVFVVAALSSKPNG